MFLPVLVSARIATVPGSLTAATLVQLGHLTLLLRTFPAEVRVLLTFLVLANVNTSSPGVCHPELRLVLGQFLFLTDCLMPVQVFQLALLGTIFGGETRITGVRVESSLKQE